MTDHDAADERPRRPVRRSAPAATGHGGRAPGARWDDPNGAPPPPPAPDPAPTGGGRPAAPNGREAWSGTSAVGERPARRPRVTYASATGATGGARAPAPTPGGAAPGGDAAGRGAVMDANAWANGLRSAEGPATAAAAPAPTAAVPVVPGRGRAPRPDRRGGATGTRAPLPGPAPAPAAAPAPPYHALPARVGVPGPLRNPVSPESTLPGVPRGALTPGVPSGAAPPAGRGGPPTGAWAPGATMPPAPGGPGGPAGPATAGWPSTDTTQAHPAAPSPGGAAGATGATAAAAAFAAGSGAPAPPAGASYDAGYGEVRDPYGPWSPPPTGPDGLPLWGDESDASATRRSAGASGHAAGDAGDAGNPTPRRPGLGLLVGILGLAALVASFVALPWASDQGTDATFLELRDVVTAAAPGPSTLAAPGGGELALGASGATPSGGATTAQMPGDTVPGGGTTLPMGDPTATTLPVTPPAPTGADPSATPGASVTTTVPAAGTAGTPSASTTVPAPARAAPASPLDPSAGGRRADFAQMFVEYLWLVVVAVALLAVVTTTLWVARGRGGRMLTGLLVSGPVGFLANAADKTGAVGPRVAGVAGTLAAAALYGAAVFAIFGREPAPEPALGVWVGEAGLAAVVMACLIGTRRARN